MSAVAEVLDPFIEETGRATAGSHSLSEKTMLVTSYFIFFFLNISQHFFTQYMSVTTSVYLHH